jgi:hypothetical protein
MHNARALSTYSKRVVIERRGVQTMKRMLLVMAIGVLLLALSAGTALAINIVQCRNVPCDGTNKADRIFERIGNHKDDSIFAKDGPDVVNAADFKRDRDRVRGEGGNDRIRTDDGDARDTVNCGAGNDNIAVIDPGDSAAANCQTVRAAFTGTAEEFASASKEVIIAKSKPAN